MNINALLVFSTGSPVLEYEPSLKEPQTLKAGSSLLLPVNVHGEPKPEVVWYHNDQKLHRDVDVDIEGDKTLSRLTISKLTGARSGSYKVVATNPVGSDEAVFSVTITGKVLP